MLQPITSISRSVGDKLATPRTTSIPAPTDRQSRIDISPSPSMDRITRPCLKATTDLTENVKVAVRCRPLSQQEQLSNIQMAWHVDPSRARVQLLHTTTRLSLQQEINPQANRPNNKVYCFDNVAYGSDNGTLYERMVRPLVAQAMDGYNVTVFAYGQTASGKTYTMMGTDTQPGIIPRTVDEVFSFIQKTVKREFLLRVSYLEIYNETIRDLLAPQVTRISIHESKQRGVYVTPLKEEIVTCAQDVLKVIQDGERKRHTSTTDYNTHSSRSHTIFQMVIESRQPCNDHQVAPCKESVKISQLNLIDLAGSEKAASDQERRKEGSFINKSLLTLGTVISKLTETGKSAGHIPYRDSKLTRILQPSLSGRAKVAVICTISPSAVDESISTLKFATRVKKIVVSAKNNEVVDVTALLQQYRGEINDLTLRLQTANQVLLQEKETNRSMIAAERKQYEQELSQMKLVRKTLVERIDHLSRLILIPRSVTPPLLPQAASTHLPDQVNTPNPWILISELRRKNDDLKEQVLEERTKRRKVTEDLKNEIVDLKAQIVVIKAGADLMPFLTSEGSRLHDSWDGLTLHS